MSPRDIQIDDDDRPLRIGKVADLAGVNVQTLRYYERLGLIESPNRRSSGHREYTYKAVEQVRLIKEAQSLGFSLKSIEDIIQLCAEGNDTQCVQAFDKASRKIEEINEKIESLISLRSFLESLIKPCVTSPSANKNANGSASPCEKAACASK